MNYPFVSVIIPTYNYAQYIMMAIESVQQQDYPSENIEIIVVDDGSTDNTSEVLVALIQQGKIKYLCQQNMGKASATSNGIKVSSGKYIFNLDADDYFLRNKIMQTVKIFEEDESIVHVASPAKFFDEEKQIITGNEELPQKILGVTTNGKDLLDHFYNNNIFFGSGSTYAARADILKTITITDDTDMYIDEFLVLAVLPFGNSFFIKEPLSVWRIHRANYSGKIKDAEQQKLKAKRLLKSSAAILDYLNRNNYNESLVKIYKLKNSNRLMAYKELEKSKKLKDIILYAKEVFFDIRPNWKLILKYQVLNRLLPLPLYNILKKLSRSLG